MAAPNQDTRNDSTGRTVQDRLIEAAEDLFCRRGFNDTSVRDIAAAADCNVASVNYYFGGKESLYLEIWRRRLDQMRESRLASIEKVMSESQPRLEDLLRSYATTFLEPLFEGEGECRFINLMAREMIDPHLPQDMFTSQMAGPVMSALSKALMQICPWLNQANAQAIIIVIVGQLIHAVCVKEMFDQSSYPEIPQLSVQDLVEHIVRFSAGGIRAYANPNGA